MRSDPNQARRQGALLAALLGSMMIGIIFGILGKNPFDPSDLWGKHPQNDLFLWISTTAFLGAVVFSYLIWPQVRVEAERKKISTGKESSSLWYGNETMRQVSWLAYLVLIPGLSLAWFFGDLTAISHIEMFLWLRDGVVFVAIVANLVVVGLMIKSFRQRAGERKMGSGPSHDQ